MGGKLSGQIILVTTDLGGRRFLYARIISGAATWLSFNFGICKGGHLVAAVVVISADLHFPNIAAMVDIAPECEVAALRISGVHVGLTAIG